MEPNRKKVNHQLKKLGFGGLDDPEIVHQLAFCIRDHDHLKQLLFAAVPVEQRTLAYETLRPHLNFTPRSLSQYQIEIEQQMEREQTPVQLRDGSIVDFKNFHGEKPSIEVMAEEAINQAGRRALADGNYPRVTLRPAPAEGILTLTCAKCTGEEEFRSLDRIVAAAEAVKKGWVFTMQNEKEISICPKCPAARLLAHA
jgi:hypothetical protein